MDKLYWIACEEGDKTLFEGRYLGRTRGAAIKFLKERIGRPNLTNVVFTITEIPVPLIRELVAEILSQGTTVPKMPEVQPAAQAAATTPTGPAVRFDAFAEPQVAPPKPRPAPGTQPDWDAVRACYLEGRGPTEVARLTGVSLPALKTRIHREGWAHQRREGGA